MARSDATRRSHAKASSRPAASAQPSIAGDHRLADLVQAAGQPTEAQVDDLAHPARTDVDVVRRDVRPEIGARAERVAGPTEDRDVDLVVVPEVGPDRLWSGRPHFASAHATRVESSISLIAHLLAWNALPNGRRAHFIPRPRGEGIRKMPPAGAAS